MRGQESGGILEGVRVLDFGRYIAGPYCAALLGDLGAEVIRIERRDGSEDRFVQPIVPEAGPGEGGEGAMFLQMNRNKRGLTLDPMTETGRGIVRRLAATADVVVANLPPSTLKAMGLDYESLTAVKPDIILTTVSAFGHGGPYSERTGFDGVAQSMVGAAYLTGHPDEPVKSYAPWVDFGTASLSAFGTLAALMERQKSGKGQVVEGSLLSTALAYFNFHLIEQELRKTNRVAIGNRSPYAGPADIVRTKDGWILVQVIGMPLFKRWARLMGEDHWLTDPRFKDDLSRGDHGEILSERTQRWAETRTTEEALAELEAARIPAGPVYSPQQALEDRHIQEMGYLKPLPFPGLPGPAPVMETPLRFSRTPASLRERAPLLGEHTDAILGELGYTTEEIESFRSEGVI
ncbi:MAG: formyl-CoA transferase [Parvibaculum sp.]|jgi:crotonobetainyl-CoA:carnitine CoA-transferase CaiB-like acyl-CoA transferase|uniref:CaiB/BaiF CoA transferase family protein n=1 Tax=Parvibaculum sp. TaxID=2024848 RepID=UPI000C62C419|nr:CoA transferase [Parvibaculum sp.]MAU62306.1 formyl-CoA transferase [Parvibaculum sp.]HAC58790.1 CoA transferase [Rhodobiaceae bacterium]|tara:strand:+ start:4601 stop:5818 length:1218 start_codon:yes stop_codon:yes gene_type:complete